MSWSYPPGENLRFTGAKPEQKRGTGSNTGDAVILAFVNIATTSTGASLALYEGPFTGAPSTTGTLIGNIDCSNNSSRALTYMIRCPNGFYGVLTPAATGADVSVTII